MPDKAPANPNITPTPPASPPPSGTVDITELVAAVKASWIQWSTLLACTAVKAIPYGVGAFFALPVISGLLNFFVEKLMTIVANGVEQEAFFLNTSLRKAGQASDFINAVAFRNSLPKTATSEEYENAEKRQMAAFRNFVRVTN
jgi:hypothetical protein